MFILNGLIIIVNIFFVFLRGEKIANLFDQSIIRVKLLDLVLMDTILANDSIILFYFLGLVSN